MKLNLTDFQPQKAELVLSSAPERRLILRPYTLRAQLFMEGKHGGPEGVEKVFQKQAQGPLSELAYFLIEQNPYKSLDEFQDAVVSGADRLAMSRAILHALGVNQELLKRMTEESGRGKDAGNEQSLNQPIGATSTTALLPSTDIVSTNS